MSVPSANMLVAVLDGVVCIKISGRANFTSSLGFKALIHELKRQDHHHFVIDLSECLIMDSTFLGVLAGLGMKLAGIEPGNLSACPMELLNPNARVADLLDNLGVLPLFKVSSCPPATVAQFEPVALESEAPSRADISRNCLEAHRTLMALNPANDARFKDVTRFLAEDLKKAECQGA
jgi:anti-sigma B factor antagonist